MSLPGYKPKWKKALWVKGLILVVCLLQVIMLRRFLNSHHKYDKMNSYYNSAMACAETNNMEGFEHFQELFNQQYALVMTNHVK